jgi:hypothetical protein
LPGSLHRPYERRNVPNAELLIIVKHESFQYRQTTMNILDLFTTTRR